MLIETSGYDYLDRDTGEWTHFDTTRNTSDLHWGKYNCQMAVYLDSLAANGGEDDWAGNADMGGSILRFGKWTLEYDDRGFVTAYKHASVEDACVCMVNADEYYNGTDDDDDESEID